MMLTDLLKSRSSLFGASPVKKLLLFSALLFGFTGFGQVVTIQRNNDPQEGQVAPSDSFTINVQASFPQSGSVIVGYEVLGTSTATPGVDYVALSNEVEVLYNFLNGSRGSAIIQINVLEDILVEGNESVTIRLVEDNANYSIGSDGEATITIQDNDASVAFSTASSEGQENIVDNLPTLIVNGGVVNENSSVAININPSSTATVNEDFLLTANVNIPPGTYTDEPFPILSILDEAIVELDETLVLELGTLTGDIVGAVAPNTTTYTILNDDSVTVAFSSAEGSGAENSGAGLPTLFVTGTVSAPTTVTVTDLGTGTAIGNGTDYTFTSPQTVNIPAGVYDGTAATAIVIPTLGITFDAQVEPDEIINFGLGNATGDATLGAITSTSYTILNDDINGISINGDVSLNEGNTGATAFVFPVVRNGDTSLIGSATFTVTPSGANPANEADFAGNTFPNGSVSFPVGATSANLTVNVNGELTEEPNETFTVTLSNPSSGHDIGTATAVGTIMNDDKTYTATIVATTSEARENPPTPGAFTINLSTENTTGSPIVINYGISGTASAGSDYATLSGSVSIPNGLSMATVPVTPINDSDVELDETVTVTLANGSGYELGASNTASVNIISDDRTNISINDILVDEYAGTAMFTVTSTSSTPSGFTVSYTTANGTANAGRDYISASGMLTFLGNQGETHNITVTVSDDGLPENNETFFVNLSTATNFVTLLKSQGVGTIKDNDNCVPQPIRVPGIPTTFCNDELTQGGAGQDLNEYVAASDIPTGYSLIWSRSSNFNNMGAREDGLVFNAGTYYGFLSNGTCTSIPLAVNLAKNDPPAIVSTAPATICGPGTVTLSATASAAGGSILWYASETATTSIGQGSNFTTPNIEVTTIYYVEVFANGCTSERVPVTATVTEPLGIGTTTDTVVCNDIGGSNAILDLDNTRVGGTVGGTWSIVGTPPGPISIGADNEVNFEGAIVGDYVFRFTADTSGSPCVVDSMETTLDVTITVDVCVMDLSLQKTVDRTEVSEGKEVVFNVILTNHGQVVSTNVRINELIDPNITGFQYVSHSVSKGIYDVARGVWELDEVLALEENTLTITAIVVREGTFQNVVSLVDSFPEDVDTTNNTARVSVTVGPRSIDECGFLFNQISPNGDGINDALYINCIDQYPNNSIQVYDRYGNEVFVARRYDNSWTGTGKNGNLPKGTYFYTLDLGDGTEVRKGWIQIIRQ